MNPVAASVPVGFPLIVPVAVSKVNPGAVLVMLGLIEKILLPYPPAAVTGMKATAVTPCMSVLVATTNVVVKGTANTVRLNDAILD